MSILHGESFWKHVNNVIENRGASVARKFASSYKVALMTRSESTFTPTVDEINSKYGDGRAIGISGDVSNEDHVKAAFGGLTTRADWTHLAAAVFNGAGGFTVKPFLDLSLTEFEKGFRANGLVLLSLEVLFHTKFRRLN